MQGSARLGALLRECREAKGVSVDDLSRATRIGPRHILALEEDRFRDLPAPVFVRGFIRSYCAAVNEPPERALALYDDVAKAPRGPSAVPRTVLAEPAGARGRSRLGWRRLALAGLVVFIGGAAYLIASSASSRPPEPARPRDDRPAARQPAAPPPEPVVAASTAAAAPAPAAVPRMLAPPAPLPPVTARAAAPSTAAPPATPRVTAPPAAVPPAAPAASAPAAGAPVEGVSPVAARPHVLVARVHEATWVVVRGADGTFHQELLEAGAVREWQSPGRFTVTVGNAAGLTLELDGVALPPLGERGQVVRDLRIPREATP
jgi:cytoskeleton protein RodZ